MEKNLMNFNPQNQFGELQPSVQEALIQQSYQTSIDVNATAFLQNNQSALRRQEIYDKARFDYETKIAILEKAQDFELEKENATIAAYFGPKETIMLEVRLPNGKSKSNEVIAVKNLRLTPVKSYLPGRKEVTIYKIAWDFADTPLYFSEEGLNGLSLRRALTKSGVAVKDFRHNNEAVMESVLALLFKFSNPEEYLYYGRGWRQGSDGKWHFVQKLNKTFMEVKDYVR